MSVPRPNDYICPHPTNQITELPWLFSFFYLLSLCLSLSVSLYILKYKVPPTKTPRPFPSQLSRILQRCVPFCYYLQVLLSPFSQMRAIGSPQCKI
ncbi:hypothetical protein HanHA300_Chr12g0439621 [Helianthus annuus]|nr:hypothetical protein HanHA300_Chr12g0439621 [Helianthus annuus]KAJ0504930.1 hypothetical protein HanHA89_Chr12g0464741 [Helianthus annuus]KAJ0674620.1 hypothetical protein HanLR1_Chr12g0441931 [Helianthus annuus]